MTNQPGKSEISETFDSKPVVPNHKHHEEYVLCEHCIGIMIILIFVIMLLGMTLLPNSFCYVALFPGVLMIGSGIVCQLYCWKMRCTQCHKRTSHVVRRIHGKTILFQCDHCNTINDSMIKYNWND